MNRPARKLSPLAARRIAAALLLALAPPAARAQAPVASGSALMSAAVEVADMPRARRFYIDVLGMKPMFAAGRPGEAREELGLNFSGDPRAAETMILLVHRAPGAPDGPRPGLVFRVADARAAIARARAAGFAIVGEVAPLPGAPFLRGMARDGDGALVELLQPVTAP